MKGRRRGNKFDPKAAVNAYKLLRSTPAQRNIDYNQYRGHDKITKIAYQVENGQILMPETNTANIPYGVFGSYNNHGQNPNLISSRRINADGAVSTAGGKMVNLQQMSFIQKKQMTSVKLLKKSASLLVNGQL